MGFASSGGSNHSMVRDSSAAGATLVLLWERNHSLDVRFEGDINPKGRGMSILQSEAERDRSQYDNLVKHYRPIGPPAIAAAVAAAKCGSRRSRRRAAEKTSGSASGAESS